MTSDEIGAPPFPLRKQGYDRAHVEWHLAINAKLRQMGFHPVMPPPGGFNRQSLQRGYDRVAVDQFFSALATEAAAAGLRVLLPITQYPTSADDDPDRPSGAHRGAPWREYEGACQAEWQRASALPGIRLHLTMEKSPHGKGKIISDSGQVLLSGEVLLTGLRVRPGRLLAGDRELPVEEIVSDTKRFRHQGIYQVTDQATGDPVLWFSGSHVGWHARGRVLLPGQRCFRFPVRGTALPNAVMTAVTESGSTLLWFRRIANGVTEVVVSPDYELSREVLCVTRCAGPWLDSFFRSPSS